MPIRMRRDGQEARDWLRSQLGFVNSKWKHVDLEWFGQTNFQARKEGGDLTQYTQPPGYVLIYRRLFELMNRVEIRFAESDIISIAFRKSKTMSVWDAHYSLRIDLNNGMIELIYRPPFYGVTPIANARHSEEVRMSHDLHYSENG